MIEKALKRLGYTTDWLDLEIITEELLCEQLIEINQSDDNNAEHYRHRTFNVFIDRQTYLTDIQLEKILQLMDNGPDKTDLHISRIISLIYSGLLNNAQFEKLSQYNEVLNNPIQKLYLRTKLIRNIKQYGLLDYFDQVAEIKDSAVHEFALSRKDLSSDHLLWLSRYACNKKLRYQAKQLIVKLSSQ